MSESKQTATVEQMAKICDITARRVQQLAKEGVMIKDGRGRYLLLESISNYFKYLHSSDQPSNVVSYTEHRSRKMKAEADRAERENMIAEGNLIERSAAGFEISDAVSVVSGILENLKLNIARIAPEVPNRALDLIEKEQAKAMKAVCELDTNYTEIQVK